MKAGREAQEGEADCCTWEQAMLSPESAQLSQISGACSCGAEASSLE